jgi:hypothetical protein
LVMSPWNVEGGRRRQPTAEQHRTCRASWSTTTATMLANVHGGAARMTTKTTIVSEPTSWIGSFAQRAFATKERFGGGCCVYGRRGRACVLLQCLCRPSEHLPVCCRWSEGPERFLVGESLEICECCSNNRLAALAPMTMTMPRQNRTEGLFNFLETSDFKNSYGVRKVSPTAQ